MEGLYIFQNFGNCQKLKLFSLSSHNFEQVHSISLSRKRLFRKTEKVGWYKVLCEVFLVSVFRNMMHVYACPIVYIGCGFSI